jgi:hypothetical protein
VRPAVDGVRLNEHIDDVDAAVVIRQAYVMGLEGIVAKQCCRASSVGREGCFCLSSVAVGYRRPTIPVQNGKAKEEEFMSPFP